MKKEYIIGGLAIVGGLSLLAYLTSKPRRNSEGFFNAKGRDGGEKNPILPIEECNLPNNFVRQVVTNNNGLIKRFCGRYYRVVAMTPTGKGFEYRLTPNIHNLPFYKGSFINQNGVQIISSYRIISSSDYESAFINGQNC